jgi:putative membrane protein insertion efficiency factor
MRALRAILGRLVTSAVILAIQAYQMALRPLLVGACKFHPSCSEYAIQALQTQGLRRGGLLAIRRLLRCHPFAPGGLDPVPSGDETDPISGSVSCPHRVGGC